MSNDTSPKWDWLSDDGERAMRAGAAWYLDTDHKPESSGQWALAPWFRAKAIEAECAASERNRSHGNVALLAEIGSLQRELERWRHGITIESDFVCPDSLAMSALLKVVEGFAEADCAYGDGCPQNAGTKHGTCTGCQARHAIASLATPIVCNPNLMLDAVETMAKDAQKSSVQLVMLNPDHVLALVNAVRARGWL